MFLTEVDLEKSNNGTIFSYLGKNVYGYIYKSISKLFYVHHYFVRVVKLQEQPFGPHFENLDLSYFSTFFLRKVV